VRLTKREQRILRQASEILLEVSRQGGLAPVGALRTTIDRCLVWLAPQHPAQPGGEEGEAGKTDETGGGGELEKPAPPPASE